jgi:hypothetical protein
MSLALNKRIAEMAVAHVLRSNVPPHKKPMVASNWDYYRQSPTAFERTRNPAHIDAADRCVVNLRAQWKDLRKKGGDKLTIIRSLAKLARMMGCGNCEDMAAVAFDYCYTMGARPLDLMNLVGVSHAFVVLGRQPSSDLRRPDTWGPASYVCDPWGAGLKGKDSYGLYPGKDFVRGMSRVAPGFRNLIAVYSLR